MILSEEKMKAIAKVKRDGYNLKFLPQFADDDDVVLEAVKNETLAHGHELALSFASDRIRDNDQIVEEALRCAGLALEAASPRLQDNERTVLIAIQQDPISLGCASKRLRNSFEFLAKIIKEYPEAMIGAGEEIQNDKAQILKLASINPKILKYLRNKDIKKEIKHQVKKR